MAEQRIDRLEQQFPNFGSFPKNIMKVDETNSKVDTLSPKQAVVVLGKAPPQRAGANTIVGHPIQPFPN